jgi:HemY protein
MRAALWLVSLFAVAVATALLASNNVGTVSIFWTPYRLDLSLNLVLFALVMILLTVHWAQRALTALFELPKQAKRWRLQQKERATHAALLDSLAQFMEGRFLRARKSAELVLVREKSLSDAGEVLDHAGALRCVAHILAAESELSDSVCVCHSTVPQSHTLAAAAMIGRRAGSRCVPIQMNVIH